MTDLEIAIYLIVGLAAVVLATWSLFRRQDRRPELFRGYVLLSLSLAGMFLIILSRAWRAEELGANQFLLAALAAGLYSTAAALVACQARLARRQGRLPPS